LNHFLNAKFLKIENYIGIWGVVGVVGKPPTSQV
jgi:hypothetical protein